MKVTKEENAKRELLLQNLGRVTISKWLLTFIKLAKLSVSRDVTRRKMELSRWLR